jgi:haloalkane dehalogenase
MSTTEPTGKHRVTVDGRRMAYVEIGAGDPIVFLHGNPTSSYLWRGVLPHLAGLGRLLAPDLIGMGDSDKLPDAGPGSYTFAEHRRYLDAWFDAVGATDRVTLVLHDWGSALGFDWARRHAGAVDGIAYLEAIVRPLTWSDLGPAGELFAALRSSEGEDLVLRDNMVVEAVLPAGVLDPLPPDALTEYRRPFTEPGEGRRPTLAWPRQIPIDGEPADVAAVVDGYSRWMATTSIPKLFINGDPGAALVGAACDHCRTWPNQTEVTVRGRHFLQEDSADQIGRHLRSWLTLHVKDGRTDQLSSPVRHRPQ